MENGATSSSSTPPTKNKLSANVTRSVAVKLGSDEVFDYGENCIDLGSSTRSDFFHRIKTKWKFSAMLFLQKTEFALQSLAQRETIAAAKLPYNAVIPN